MSFPKQIVVRSAKPGATSASRKVLNGVDSVDSSGPTLPSEGTLLNRNEFVHLFFNVDTTDSDTTFYVQIWWYSAVSEQWHKGERLSVNDNDVATIEVQGLSRIDLQVDSIVNGASESGTPSIDAWIGLVVPV